MKGDSKQDLSMFKKSLCAVIAGFTGAVVGNPADLALIRM